MDNFVFIKEKSDKLKPTTIEGEVIKRACRSRD